MNNAGNKIGLITLHSGTEWFEGDSVVTGRLSLAKTSFRRFPFAGLLGYVLAAIGILAGN
jgi:hypothetical protein